MRGCARTRRALLRHVDGDADLDQSLRVEDHLEHCPECRRHLERHQQVEEWLVSLPRPELTERDQDRLLAGIHQRIDERESSRRPAPMRHLLPLAAAAALIGGISLGWHLRSWGGDPPPPPPRVASGDQEPPPAPAVEGGTGTGSSPGNRDSASSSGPPVLDRAMVEAQQQFHADLAHQLASLERDSSPCEELLAEMADRTSRRNLIRGLEIHLGHADPAVAATAARALVELLGRQELGLSAPSVCWSLEQALERPDRAFDVFALLSGAALPDRERMLRHALDQPHLVGEASRVVLASQEPDLATLRATTLRRLWRAEDPALRDQCVTLVATLAPVRPEDLSALLELYQEGMPREALTPVLEQLTGAAQQRLIAWLQDRKASRRTGARALVAMSGNPSFASVLADQVVQAQDAVAALDTLVELGNPTALLELWRLRDTPGLSGSLQGLVREGAIRLVQQAAEPLRLLQRWQREDPEIPSAALVQLAAEVPGVRGSDLLLSLASLPGLRAADRADAALRLALRTVPDSAEGAGLRDHLLAWLPGPDLLRSDPASAASLLVSLYLVEEDQGVRQGLEVLGFTDRRHRQEPILRLTAAAARQAPAGRQGDLVARLAELLQTGP